MLWIPGPTEVRPELLAECARPMIGHRSADMKELIARLDPHLRLAFGLREESTAAVAVHTCSATGIMESSLIGAGRRILCLVNGAFSKRWSEIAALLGKDVTVFAVPWGAAPDPGKVGEILREQGPFDALTLISNETSTGVRTPLAPFGKLLREHPSTLLLVDVVSYLAGAPVDFDVHGLDLAFAGSQKALALPPGITVLCASQRFLERARAQKLRGFYLDPVRIVEGHAKRETPSTPAISLYFALARQLEDISGGVTLPPSERSLRGARAWTARFEKHTRMQRATAGWAKLHGLELLPAPEHASTTVSCIRAGRCDVAALLNGLKTKGERIGNGYGEWKDRSFRIGHMGDHTEEGLARLLAAADEVLAGL
jgi:aspartate aminotransferase-like enzyme